MANDGKVVVEDPDFKCLICAIKVVKQNSCAVCDIKQFHPSCLKRHNCNNSDQVVKDNESRDARDDLTSMEEILHLKRCLEDAEGKNTLLQDTFSRK